jgi:hypothetical protein
LQSVAALHAAAIAFCGVQVPLAAQYAVGAQSVSAAQVMGHETPPLQRYVAPHTVPEASVEHVPLVVAPDDELHDWHVPPHAVRQHTPSKQPLFVASHSWQPACLQSALAHDAPFALRAVHVPLLAQ